MAMSKKDYEAIAEVLRRNKRSSFPVDVIADDMATMLQADNPRFRRDQFLAACRGESFDAPIYNGKTRKVNYGV
jgi:hypothetical protein